MSKIILIHLLAFILSTPIFAAETSLSTPLYFPLKSQVWVENGKILKAVVEGTRIKVIPLNIGASQIKIGDQLHQIHVLDPKVFSQIKVLKQTLQKTLNLNLGFHDGQATVDGKMYDFSEFKSVLSVAQTSGLELNAWLPNELKLKIQSWFTQELENENLPAQKILFNKPWQVRIPQNHPLLPSYQKFFRKRGLRVFVDSDSLNLAPLVKIKITVAEIRKDWLRKIGIRWPSELSATLLSNNQWQRSDMNFSFEALENLGVGKVLASPYLLARSGTEAQFFAGGEIPIKIINYRHQSVEWKQYGIQMKILPKADSSGKMNIKIETEISSVDESKKIDDIPAFTRNKVESQFDLGQAQTILLSGLIQQVNSKQSEGLPSLSKLPILGALFSSKDFLENKTELFILVRPEIVRPFEAAPEFQDSEHLSQLELGEENLNQ